MTDSGREQEYRQKNDHFGHEESGSEVLAYKKIGSFYNDKGNIQTVLFDETAKNIAKTFSGKDRYGKKVGVSSTQIRRIFDEVKRFDQLIGTSAEQWDKQLPYIKMIKSKVCYTVARAVKTKPSEKEVYQNLAAFIADGVDTIKTKEDYHVFVSLFEAVYGFYYEAAPKD